MAAPPLRAAFGLLLLLLAACAPPGAHTAAGGAPQTPCSGGGGPARSSGGAPPQRPPAAPPGRGAAGGGSPELPPPPPPRRLPRGSGGGSGGGAPPCGLRSVAVRVRDLGLGYPSEETVLFRYCGGACPAPPSNHGLALARLRPGGGPGGAPGGAGPCCRPSRYEDAAFLDERHRWHQLRQLSAAACRCVG